MRAVNLPIVKRQRTQQDRQGTDMPTLCRAFAWVLVMLVAPSCFAQEVTVRVVNAADGRPLKKVPVSVRAIAPAQHDLRLKTDANGEVRFPLPESAPPHLRVDVLISRTHWDCGCFAEGATGEVIQKGIVAPAGGKATNGVVSLKAVPAQILIPIRPLSFGERLYMFFIGQ
jgi:hypothetical protein